MLKVSENPPIIWPQVGSICDFTGQWWVAHTRSRNEKALAHDLISKNISYFLPMSWKVRRRSRRTIRSFLPLFSGYLFFCGQEEQRIELLRTNRVANLIEVIAGPLIGLEGVVVKTRGAIRLVLQIDILGQAASVEIDIDMIEVLD